MTEKTVLEWLYEPSNYFEAPYSYVEPAYELVVRDGKALATLIIPQEPVDPTLVTFIDEKVKAIFTGKQLLTHLPFTWGAYASVNIGQMGANT